VDIRGVGRAHRYPLQGQEPPPPAVAHQAGEAAVALPLPQLASPLPPEPLPLATVGQPRAVHKKQRFLLGEEGLELLPEPREEAPKLLLPYPLGEAVQGLSRRGRAGQGRGPGKAPLCGGKWPHDRPGRGGGPARGPSCRPGGGPAGAVAPARGNGPRPARDRPETAAVAYRYLSPWHTTPISSPFARQAHGV
jgi:hypothetical protein